MKFYAVLTLIFLLMFTPLTFASNETIAKAHRAAHEIDMTTIIEATSCSATSIGPYAILTASHCEEPNENITVDGDTPAKIIGIMRDGNDHSIYFLNMEKPFAAWAQVADTLPEVGETVFIFGNPGDMTDVFRQGYVSKIKTKKASSIEAFLSGEPSHTVILYDMLTMEGDSGSAIFDARSGEIVGVIMGDSRQGDAVHGWFNLAVSFQLVFSRDDLKRAETYAPPVQKK